MNPEGRIIETVGSNQDTETLQQPIEVYSFSKQRTESNHEQARLHIIQWRGQGI